MSADRQRLTSAIRRIAKTDPEIRGLLDAADNKGGKPGAAGVGSSTDAESQRICCDGSTSGNTNPGAEERDPEDGGQTGIDPSDPADTGDQGPGTLSGVTDCATGEPVCFDGDGFIPPDGWDGPSDPPIDPYYTAGIYAELYVNGDYTYHQTYYGAAQIVTALCESSCPDTTPCPAYPSEPVGFICGDQSASAKETNCGFEYNAICDEPPPLAESWPTDGCVNLAVKGGTIVGSKYDPENDGSYSAPRDSIDLCDGSGNQISLAPSADGGWKTINSTTNKGYLYDSSGKQIAHIDGNEYSDPSV